MLKPSWPILSFFEYQVYGDKDADGFYRGETCARVGLIPCNMVSEIQADDEEMMDQLLKQGFLPLNTPIEKIGKGKHRLHTLGLLAWLHPLCLLFLCRSIYILQLFTAPGDTFCVSVWMTLYNQYLILVTAFAANGDLQLHHSTYCFLSWLKKKLKKKRVLCPEIFLAQNTVPECGVCWAQCLRILCLGTETARPCWSQFVSVLAARPLPGFLWLSPVPEQCPRCSCSAGEAVSSSCSRAVLWQELQYQ